MESIQNRGIHTWKGPTAGQGNSISPLSALNGSKSMLLSDMITFPGSLALINYTLRDLGSKMKPITNYLIWVKTFKLGAICVEGKIN